MLRHKEPRTVTGDLAYRNSIEPKAIDQHRRNDRIGRPNEKVYHQRSPGRAQRENEYPNTRA
jgi:hypothetical protein